MQLRADGVHGNIESNGATGIVEARANDELAGALKSAWNFHSVNASCGAPYGPPSSIVPT
jgi:hypothetical protein